MAQSCKTKCFGVVGPLGSRDLLSFVLEKVALSIQTLCLDWGSFWTHGSSSNSRLHCGQKALCKALCDVPIAPVPGLGGLAHSHLCLCHLLFGLLKWVLPGGTLEEYSGSFSWSKMHHCKAGGIWGGFPLRNSSIWQGQGSVPFLLWPPTPGTSSHLC